LLETLFLADGKSVQTMNKAPVNKLDFSKSLNQNIHIIPQPYELKVLDGCFCLQDTTVIVAGQDVLRLADYLRDRLRSIKGIDLEIVRRGRAGSVGARIELAFVTEWDNLGEEGYRVEIDTSTVRIRAPRTAGLFYGIQSMLQLFDWNTQAAVLPCVAIKDFPRFQWRGALLDVSRHFFPVNVIKKFIDRLSFHKINVFHWHLVDDQGWRIEIKKYPELVHKGSRRRESPKVGARQEGDGTPYGPFWYSQDEVKEIVAYAQERCVTVLPEIEMPGHSSAALAVFPHLSCKDGPFDVETRWGIFKNVFCAGNEAVFDFLQDVLDEVIGLFPSEYIHVGGDECPKQHWRECAHCQQRIQQEGLDGEEQLQSYFMQRIERFIASRGRKLIGWDEILEGGLSREATVMSWRGESGGIAAAKAGNDVVMTPFENCYLDFYQSVDIENEPEAIGDYLPLHRVYNYNPIPAELQEAEAKHILGVQGNIWTEYIQRPKLLEYMAFPRLCAIAEIGWSAAHVRNYATFAARLTTHCHRLDGLQVGYRPLHDLSARELKAWELTSTDPGRLTELLELQPYLMGTGTYRLSLRVTRGDRKFKTLSIRLSCKGCNSCEWQLKGCNGVMRDAQTYFLELENLSEDDLPQIHFDAQLAGDGEAVVVLHISKENL